MSSGVNNASRDSAWPGDGAAVVECKHFMVPKTLTSVRRANVTKAPARRAGQALALRLRRAPGQERNYLLTVPRKEAAE
jgi:hypothetical protein